MKITIKIFFSISVFLIFTLMLESAARFVFLKKVPMPIVQHWQNIQPYIMFSTPASENNLRIWNDQYKKTNIKSLIIQNEQGFPSKERINYAKKYDNNNREDLVILTGGSAAWGVGATDNESTLDGVLEKRLNEKKKNFKVLNMAMGGWKSEQEFIALGMYGKNFAPEYIICMDGVNDVAVAVAHSQGAGYPMYYASMEAFFKAYCFSQLKPVFFRGKIENEILKYSYFARWITGNTPISFSVTRDFSDPQIERSIIREANAGDAELQLQIYEQMLENISLLFPDSKIIFALQPVPFDFKETFHRLPNEPLTPKVIFAKQSRLNETLKNLKNQKAGLSAWPEARQWFLESAEIRISNLCEKINKKRKIKQTYFINLNKTFPQKFEERKQYFIDPVHCNNDGYQIIGQALFEIIQKNIE
jgi:hypothetical protein